MVSRGVVPILSVLVSVVLARECNRGKPADVVFLLDASNSIWPPDYQRQLDFVNEVVHRFTVGKDQMRVGVVTFAEQPIVQFSLNTYHKKHDLKMAISRIPRVAGRSTLTNKAIRYLREKALSVHHGARPGVVKVGIIITDGQSEFPLSTRREASLARKAGIHLFAIGVGDRVDIGELYAIASRPANKHVNMVADYQSLDRLKHLLAVRTCAATAPPTTTPRLTTSATPPTTTTTTTTTTPTNTVPSTSRILNTLRQGYKSTTFKPRYPDVGYLLGDQQYSCAIRGPTDIVFAIDSQQSGSSSASRLMWRFIRDVIAGLQLEEDHSRISFIHDCIDVPGLKLDQYTNKTQLLKELDNMRVHPKKSAHILRTMKHKLTAAEKHKTPNDVQPRKKIGIYITDSKSGDIGSTIREAQDSRINHNIEMYAIGIGGGIDPTELRAIVSCDVQHHFLTVPNYAGLDSAKLATAIIRNICKNSGYFLTPKKKAGFGLKNLGV